MNQLLHGWQDSPPIIKSKRLLLRSPTIEDGPELFAAITESLSNLEPWFAWTADIHLSIASCEMSAAYAGASFLSGEELQFYIFGLNDPHLMGVCGLSNINWDSRIFETCYWLRSGYEGHGYMSEALIAVSDFAFNSLSAFRIEAYCDVANKKGIAVAVHAGFSQEKIIPKYRRHHSTHEWQNYILFVKKPK